MFLRFDMNILDKAKTLEVLASAQNELNVRSDPKVVKAINKKSLEILDEI